MERLKSPSIKKLLLRKCFLILLVILFSVINLTLRGKWYSNPSNDASPEIHIELLEQQQQTHSLLIPRRSSSPRNQSLSRRSPIITPEAVLVNNTIPKAKSNHLYVNQDNPSGDTLLVGSVSRAEGNHDLLSKSFLDNDMQQDSTEYIIHDSNHDLDNKKVQKSLHSFLIHDKTTFRVKRASSSSEGEKNLKNNTRASSTARSTEKNTSKGLSNNKNG